MELQTMTELPRTVTEDKKGILRGIFTNSKNHKACFYIDDRIPPLPS